MIIRGQVVYVYDIEVFPNLFTCSCINSESKKSGTWEISQRKNDLPELIKGFLNKKIMWCGYSKILNFLKDVPVMKITEKSDKLLENPKMDNQQPS